MSLSYKVEEIKKFVQSEEDKHKDLLLKIEKDRLIEYICSVESI